MVPPKQATPTFVRMAAHPLRWQLLTELAGSDYRVRELTGRVGEPQNLVSYHLRLLRDSGLVTARRSSFDARDTYYHLDLDRCSHTLTAAGAALHPALHLAKPPGVPVGRSRIRVLFACTGNSARSPIAEALLRHRGDKSLIQVTSAGSHPKQHLDPRAVQALLEESGIDISGQRPRHLDTVASHRFDYVITLCDKVREVCPEFGGGHRPIHWSIPDPAAGTSSFTSAVTEIDTRIRHLLHVLAIPTKQEVDP